MKNSTLRLALFDLDNTLLAGDSDFEWAQFLIERGVLDRDVHEDRNRDFYEKYRTGTLDIHEFLDFQLMPLTRHPRRQLATWHAQFMREKILPLILPQGRELLASHAAEAHLIAIITATNSFVTGPIAGELAVPNLIATEPETSNGEFTGRTAGEPCFREGKISRLTNWLRTLGHHPDDIAESWFYSDSHNDLPLLSYVSHPVATDPDETLRAHAEHHGWPIISLR